MNMQAEDRGIMVETKCSIEGCDNPICAKGLCRKHYHANRQNNKLGYFSKKCSIKGCNNCVRVKGLCSTHYRRLKVNGSPYKVRRQHNLGSRHKYPREYSIWEGVKGRCTCKTDKAYHYYGGRGITICDRWTGPYGFDNFIHDMGESKGLTLDRRDVDKGYSPENCRWVNMTVQASNTRVQQKTNHRVGVSLNRGRWVAEITHNGERRRESFGTVDDAIKQRERWEVELFGKTLEEMLQS